MPESVVEEYPELNSDWVCFACSAGLSVPAYSA